MARRRRIYVLEMNCLISKAVGATLMDRIRNENVRIRIGNSWFENFEVIRTHGENFEVRLGKK